MQSPHIEQFLYRYTKSGFSFFNTLCAEKKIMQKWQMFQKAKPSEALVKKWLTLPTQNYAIVCGEISNLIVFDVDTKNGGDPTPFLNRGLFEVKTPSGGYHFYTTYNAALANTKHKKDQHDGILKAVDVQSNGSVVFAPPSFFPDRGAGYTITNDVAITPLPDDLLVQVLEALEPEAESTDYTPYKAKQDPLSCRPGDIFNAFKTWDDMLIPRGWRKVGGVRGDGTQYWRRPNKRHPNEGISASTNWKGYDLMFLYTTYYEPTLRRMKGYTKFSFLAHSDYDGDFRACVKDVVLGNKEHAKGLSNK